VRRILRRLYRSVVPTPVIPCDDETLAVLTSVLRPDSNAIDIGCNRGSILREIVRLAPRGRHFAFEPIPAHHRELSRRYPTVDCRRMALSDEKGTVQFTHFRDKDGFSGMVHRDIGPDPGQVEQIPVKTDQLDALIPADLPIALIKIDVEGAEYRVLRGAQALLRRCRPVVIFECGLGGLDTFGHTPGQVFDLLEDCGLEIDVLKRWPSRKAPLSRDDFIAIFTSNSDFMFTASPPGGPTPTAGRN